MIFYPYHNPIILTDSLYTSYGGFTGSSTPNQRAAAYLLAEMQMTEHLSTFLLPTTVTGSYFYPSIGSRLILEYGYLWSVNGVTILAHECPCVVEEFEGCATILSDTYGAIVISDKEVMSCGGCCGEMIAPFSVEVSFTAGLPSGTSYQPNMLLALTMAAGNNLKEITDPGALEAGAGDAGIEEFSAVNYREIRKKLGRNIFGNSPVANKIGMLTETLKHKRALKL
jgi:hypothetical protein